ncbi:distal membrane-arm assembly complex protein 2 [Orussus abietinus]|uniref:distal membrane-arm assembly complex protein 2 n=1 Tax=Orussus abietinus TaxID=222816 RepID=UPI000625623A|nr:distal membrane-arm assembly complex protein 2 [Orussus abietinus]
MFTTTVNTRMVLPSRVRQPSTVTEGSIGSDCTTLPVSNLPAHLCRSTLPVRNFPTYLHASPYTFGMIAQYVKVVCNSKTLISRQLYRCLSRKPEEQLVRKGIKEWRKPIEQEKSFLQMFNRDKEPNQFLQFLRSSRDPLPLEVIRWCEKKVKESIKVDQRFRPERHGSLGSDLAAAYFIVYRGGRVKFDEHSEWTKLDKDDECNMPNKFNPNYILKAIDLSGMNIIYEGLDNLRNLTKVTWASFRNCPNFDDWCLDKITGNFPQLEYLDISSCPKITERGLESIYKITDLKTLIVTNYYGSQAFDITCLMLQDCIPTLKCHLREPVPVRRKDEWS